MMCHSTCCLKSCLTSSIMTHMRVPCCTGVPIPCTSTTLPITVNTRPFKPSPSSYHSGCKCYPQQPWNVTTGMCAAMQQGRKSVHRASTNPYYTVYSMSAKYKCTYICITTINISMYKQICVIIMQATNKILAGGNVLHAKQRAVCTPTAWWNLKAKKKRNRKHNKGTLHGTLQTYPAICSPKHRLQPTHR